MLIKNESNCRLVKNEKKESDVITVKVKKKGKSFLRKVVDLGEIALLMPVAQIALIPLTLTIYCQSENIANC